MTTMWHFGNGTVDRKNPAPPLIYELETWDILNYQLVSRMSSINYIQVHREKYPPPIPYCLLLEGEHTVLKIPWLFFQGSGWCTWWMLGESYPGLVDSHRWMVLVGAAFTGKFVPHESVKRSIFLLVLLLGGVFCTLVSLFDIDPNSIHILLHMICSYQHIWIYNMYICINVKHCTYPYMYSNLIEP